MKQKALKKRKGKIHFRDLFTSVLLLMAFSLCFLLVLNGLDILHKVSTACSAKISNSYIETIAMECVPLEEYETVPREVDSIDVMNSLQIEKGNVELKGVSIKSGSTFTERGTNVFLKWTEEIPAALRSGRYPTKEDIKEGKKVVIIGNSMCQYTKTMESIMYLKIEGDWYQVIGVLEDDTASNLDERIFLFYDCMQDTLQHQLVEEFTSVQHPYVLQYETNQTDAEESANAFFEWMETKLEADYREVITEEADEENGIDAMLAEWNQWIIYILLVFSVTNCIVISNIWVKRRKKEFAIRKALGGSMIHICKLIFVELFQLAVGSMCITLIVQVIYHTVNHKEWFFEAYVIQDIGCLFLGMLGCVIMTLLIPVIQIAKMNPVNEIRK